MRHDGRASPRKLLSANQRLSAAYLLKESSGQFCRYHSEGRARTFFERWREDLKWQRLVPYRKFARMPDRHGDGIASYSRPA